MMPERPTVTTLCGSTRFPDAFALANVHLSLLPDAVPAWFTEARRAAFEAAA